MRHMIVWNAAFAIAIGGVLSAPGVAAAATFPAPLLGKSVSVNWTASRQQKFEGMNDVVFKALSMSMQVYISTAGRAFTKESVFSSGGGSLRGGRGGRGGFGLSFQGEQGPGDARSSVGRNDVVHMEGGALMVDRKLLEGARRISITFDAGYGSCTARVIMAREGGTGALRVRNPILGRRSEILSEDNGTPSCSIASGNVFGGQ
jgi:hypothetical protein